LEVVMNVPETKQPPIPPGFGLLVGVLAVSTASTFIRAAQADVTSLALAAWRLTFATLILAPFALTTQHKAWRELRRRDWWLMIASGAVLAVHFYTWITSLAMTSVAASVALVSTNPLFVGLLSYLVLKEPLNRRMVLGLFVAIVGSAVIGIEDAGGDSHRLWGDLLALSGAVAVAIYMLIGRRLRAGLSLLGYIFPVYGTAAVVLVVTALVAGVPLSGYPGSAWVWLVLVALIPQVIGHSSFNWALGHLPTTYVALAALAEPIGSTLLAWLVLDETPTWITLAGGGLILAGIGIATRPRRRRSQDRHALTEHCGDNRR
jgi:drug/metabolite transporter (DMT)-like permease